MWLSPSGCPFTGLVNRILPAGPAVFWVGTKNWPARYQNREKFLRRDWNIWMLLFALSFHSQWLRADLCWTQTMIEVQIVFTVGVITARNKCS
jgi:hypothetical protein